MCHVFSNFQDNVGKKSLVRSSRARQKARTVTVWKTIGKPLGIRHFPVMHYSNESFGRSEVEL